MIDIQHAEWQAWQNWHAEFLSLTGIDIDDDQCKRFVFLTKQWAVWFAKLAKEHPALLLTER